MADGVHVRVQTGNELACTRREHGHSRSQQALVAEGANQRQHGVRGPRSHKQETDGDGRLCDAHLDRRVGLVLVRAQRINVHLFGLLAECLLVVHDVAYDLAVIVDDEAHREDVAKGEDGAHKHAVVERVGQVVEGAGREVTL